MKDSSKTIGCVALHILLLGALVGCTGRDNGSAKTLDELIESGATISNGFPVQSQGSTSSFGKYFLPEGQIQLSEDILIGSISQLNADYESGKLLMTDRIGESVLLYRP